MFKKGSKLYSILYFKCPRCHTGELFRGSHAWDFKELGKVHNRCTHCGQNQWIEIGFYWGGMYIAYAITVFTCFMQFLTYKFLFGWSIMESFVALTIVQVIFSPWLYRLSRSIWINVFVHYDKNHPYSARANRHKAYPRATILLK